MKIHEYQAKDLFKRAGIPVLRSGIANTSEEAVDVAKGLGQGPWVVKAQVHAGGRGKAGGVKLCRTLKEVEELAKKLLGQNLVTYQSGPHGVPVNTLLIEEGCHIAKELYLAAVVDRARSAIVVMASQEGGVEIEEVAAKTPEKILKVTVDPYLGRVGYQARTLAYGLGLYPELHKAFGQLVSGLVSLVIQKDCSLVEVNPLVITQEGALIALDAKVEFDDNALYRHEELLALRDVSQEDPRDVEASKWHLNYIHLDGNIACMVNGAGLAMATMDVIKMAGGEPANFLDVGGGANAQMVTEAFKILVSDPKVKGILVNIFGGIMKCDVLALGIVEAVEQVGLKVPLVVRLEGTNVEEGKAILNRSGLNIQAASNMADAAKLIVNAVKG